MVIAPRLKDPVYSSRIMLTFDTSFYNSGPPPPPPALSRQVSTDKKPEKPKPKTEAEKIPEATPQVPVTIPSEIKTEPSDKSDKNDPINDTLKDIIAGNGSRIRGGVPGGTTGGIPGGIVGKSPSHGSSTVTEEPVRIGGKVRPPRRIKYAHPEYPLDALRVRVEGIVIIEAIIDKNGKIRDAKILKSIPLLDAAALETVKKWEYAPTTIDGKPVEVILSVIVNFKIE